MCMGPPSHSNHCMPAPLHLCMPRQSSEGMTTGRRGGRTRPQAHQTGRGPAGTAAAHAAAATPQSCSMGGWEACIEQHTCHSTTTGAGLHELCHFLMPKLTGRAAVQPGCGWPPPGQLLPPAPLSRPRVRSGGRQMHPPTWPARTCPPLEPAEPSSRGGAHLGQLQRNGAVFRAFK